MVSTSESGRPRSQGLASVLAWSMSAAWSMIKGPLQRSSSSSSCLLVFFALLILLLHQHQTIAFSSNNGPHYPSSLWWHRGDGRRSCRSWRTSSLSFSVDTTRYHTPSTAHPCRAAQRIYSTILQEKPKGKEPEKKPRVRKETKSVVENFFSQSPPPPPPPPEPEKKSNLLRGLFRRNKADENDSKNDSKKDSSKRKKVSSPKPKESKKKKEPIKSDQLRQKAKQEEKTKRRKSSSSRKKDDKKKKETKEEETNLWNRVTGWLPGGSSDGDKVNESSSSNSNNSTNPISAVQKYFQESVARRNEEWVDVIPKTRLSPGEVVPVTVGGLDLLIIAGLTSGNRVYAIANSCPHLGTPLEVGQLVRLPKEANPSVSSDTIVNDPEKENANRWTELQVSSLLQQDGCEDCIVCPLHKTAFALESGQVRGEWCPYPPVVGKLTSLVKDPTPVATFDVRVRGKNIQVRLNSLLPLDASDK